MQTTFKEHPFKQARNLGVPIIAVETADPAATIRSCAATRNGRADFFLQWDCIRGLTPIENTASEIAKEIGEPAETQNLVACLDLIAKKQPKRCSIFIHNAQAAFRDYTALQAFWNCRDPLKAVGTTLILLGPALPMPPELANDVPVFEEPAPTAGDIAAKIDGALADARKAKADYPTPSAEDRLRIVDTLTGYLSLFAIEQSLALATTKDGLNVRRLWELKVASLKNTAGLEISQPEISFKDLAGTFGAKDFFGRLIKGRQRFRGVFFLDEIEKMIAGGGGDLSGTSQAMIEQFLYWTEAKKVMAVLLLGIPGAGKSHTAACVAGEAQVPLLRGSMSTVKGSLVGESEQNMRKLLRTVDSVTQESTLLIATCNSLANLTPEILSRFKLGVFFYDYPTTEEAAALWQLYRKRYEIPASDPQPDARRWVGREIESCCHRAWLFNCSLLDAAKSVVPVARANTAKMEALRSEASGRFISAATVGIYNQETDTTKALDLGRALTLA